MKPGSKNGADGGNVDRRIGFIILGAILLLIVGISILTPASGDTDPTPSSYNTGSAGAKAAYLLMSEIGYNATRWDQPTANLRQIPAHTTLILADPNYPAEDVTQIQADIAAFLTRGGRVLVIGGAAAYLLPGGQTANPSRLFKTPCRTTPGDPTQNPLAQAGRITVPDNVRWDPAVTTINDAANHPNPVTVAQRCGDDAVVVSFPYGAGQAIWWSAATPLTNAGLKEDASLKLLLASLGSPTPSNQPTILFDEYFHGERATLWDTARGLPLAQLAWQFVLVAVLLILSFSRRNGPLRLPVTVPRTSPIEFAESMGRLYRSAGATSAATSAARRRLLQFLGERCGVPRDTLREASPAAIVGHLQTRFPGDWSRIAAHLTQAAEAEYAVLAPRSALDLVRALDRDQLDLAAAARASHPIHQTPAA